MRARLRVLGAPIATLALVPTAHPESALVVAEATNDFAPCLNHPMACEAFDPNGNEGSAFFLQMMVVWVKLDDALPPDTEIARLWFGLDHHPDLLRLGIAACGTTVDDTDEGPEYGFVIDGLAEENEHRVVQALMYAVAATPTPPDTHVRVVPHPELGSAGMELADGTTVDFCEEFLPTYDLHFHDEEDHDDSGVNHCDPTCAVPVRATRWSGLKALHRGDR